MPSPAAVPAPRGTNAARVAELEAEVRQLRRKVAELTQSLSENEENRRMLRETLDATLHQIELQTLTIDELRLELDSATARASSLAAAAAAAGGPAVATPRAPPRALDAQHLSLTDLLPLAKGAGDRLKAMQQQGVEVDVELRVLRQAIDFMKEGLLWEAQVVLHGLRVAMDTKAGARLDDPPSEAPSPPGPGPTPPKRTRARG